MPISIEAARHAKSEVKRRLALAQLKAAVGLTRRGPDYAVQVNLKAAAGDAIPAEVDGVPVVVQIVGPIVKRGAA